MSDTKKEDYGDGFVLASDKDIVAMKVNAICEV